MIDKMATMEGEGIFDVDPVTNPSFTPLAPGEFDYTNRKLSSKIKCNIANYAGKRFFESMIKNKSVIVKDVVGLENLEGYTGGAIITCNHISPFDSYAVLLALKKHFGYFRLWKIIGEWNFAQSGKVGFLMRNGNTLPISDNPKVMVECMRAVDTLLCDGNKIIVYPEQAMWWNYRKPRPLKSGAYRFAYKSNVPVIPCFITLNDSDIIGADGFPVQEYTVHISPLIYPNTELSSKLALEDMKNKNFEYNKDIYEKTYGIKLEYNTKG